MPAATSEAKDALDRIGLRILWPIRHGLQRMSKQMEGELGITGSQRLVLRVLASFQDGRLGNSPISSGCTRARLRAFCNDWSTGLLERERDPGNSRRARLCLKPPGVIYTRTAAGTLEETARHALQHAWPIERPRRPTGADGNSARLNKRP
jgi:hypothetical protein